MPHYSSPARLPTRPEENHSTRPWISLYDALNFLHGETGTVFTRQYLLELHENDQLDIYLDCSFAPACMSEHQFLAHMIKGADYCKLLHARESHSLPVGSEPGLTGLVIVQGTAWVYSQDDKEPQREEGIWCFDFGNRPRPLYFSRAEIHALGRRIRP